MMAYPAYQVSEETVAPTDAWLADDGHPASLRRLVAEGRDGVVRALKARPRTPRDSREADSKTASAETRRNNSVSTLTLRGDGGGPVSSSWPCRGGPRPDGRWTEPDLHLFPQDGHRYEIVDGSLHVTPPLADGPHEPVVRALVTTLRGAAPEGWWVCARLGVEFGASNLIPDVTVLRPHSSGAIWRDPADVALVVEVETADEPPLRPAAQAGRSTRTRASRAYWRIEPDPAPVLHTYGRAGGVPTAAAVSRATRPGASVGRPVPGAGRASCRAGCSRTPWAPAGGPDPPIGRRDRS